jgi:hypothetical protein
MYDVSCTGFEERLQDITLTCLRYYFEKTSRIQCVFLFLCNPSITNAGMYMHSNVICVNYSWVKHNDHVRVSTALQGLG